MFITLNLMSSMESNDKALHVSVTFHVNIFFSIKFFFFSCLPPFP